MCRTKSFISVAIAGFFAVLTPVLSQTTADYAVQVSAMVQTNPAQVTLSWPADPQASSYTVYRKSRDGTTWGTGATLPGAASTYIDTAVALGGAYEYRIDKAASASGASFTGEGYIYAGIQALLTDSRGKIILLVDNSFSSSLSLELARLQQDLVGDGWTVIRHDVARSNSVPAIKALILADYQSDPGNVRALFLFGHIPVPYSGNAAPDGHAGHVGAWPADVYYGDMDGIWTDSSVNTATAADSRNWNTPGDGKFDQSTLPSDVELQIGRVDLSNLPAFAQSETELLRRYLNKDHNFRFGLVQVQPHAVVCDGFGTFNGEAFAANGYRNFAPFFGAGNVAPTWDWMGTMSNQSYLWAYGCGSGEYAAAAGVTSTSNLSTNDPQVVFTMLFGSYFGDWDSQNDLLRAALATPSYTLASAWAGRPWWQLHHMALGETIGFSTRLSQNNSSTYPGGHFSRGVHVALMGDPTLRLQPVTPPQFLSIATNSSNGLDLHWGASPDANVGYHVYKAASAAGPFTRLTSSPLNSTAFTDLAGAADVYMVRAIKLQSSGSGSYYNPSQGIFAAAQGAALTSLPPRLTLARSWNGAFVLTGSGLPGQAYQIQGLDGTIGASWQPLATVTADLSGTFRFIDSGNTGQRSYRTLSQ